MSDPRWSTCPGCGVVLPGDDVDPSPRPHASAACWQLYGEVIGFEFSHVAELGRFHQLMVDAYAAQHAGPGVARIGVTFALVGLHLAIDEGWRGDEVRAAHQFLAGEYRDWPGFEAPSARADRTVFDVAMAGSPAEHASAVQAWAGSVWSAWAASSSTVVALVEERIPQEVRRRLHP